MLVIKRYGTWFFALILVMHCLFIYFGMNDARTLTKLLLIPFLMLYLFASSGGKMSPLIFCGLLFSFVGDMILTRSGELFFLFGMLAFMGTHICNSIFFLQLQKGYRANKNETLMAVIIFVAVSGILFWKLQPYLGSFQWPILFYMFIIGAMAVLAIRTMNNPMIKNIAVTCFIPGATLFVLSDATLAMNKFLLHETVVDMVVMLTYGGAQYYLVKGFSKVLSEEAYRPHNK